MSGEFTEFERFMLRCMIWSNFAGGLLAISFLALRLAVKVLS